MTNRIRLAFRQAVGRLVPKTIELILDDAKVHPADGIEIAIAIEVVLNACIAVAFDKVTDAESWVRAAVERAIWIERVTAVDDGQKRSGWPDPMPKHRTEVQRNLAISDATLSDALSRLRGSPDVNAIELLEDMRAHIRDARQDNTIN